jgi:hypothetical protein
MRIIIRTGRLISEFVLQSQFEIAPLDGYTEAMIVTEFDRSCGLAGTGEAQIGLVGNMTKDDAHVGPLLGRLVGAGVGVLPPLDFTRSFKPPTCSVPLNPGQGIEVDDIAVLVVGEPYSTSPSPP